MPHTPLQTRVPVDLDLRVWGMGADGRPFSQHARARNISFGGAMLSDIERDLKIGDTIGVQSGSKKARCKVVWSANTQSAQKIKVGVQLLKEQDCPWSSLLPKTDGFVPSVAKGQRRWERHKISMVVTLHSDQSPLPVRVTATDLSASGCYIETLAPFQIGTSLIAELCFAGQTLTTRTFVRSCDPQVGMGVEFIGLHAEEQQRFQQYLQAINPWACSIEKPKFTH
jgi:PilZ domain